MKHVLNTLAFYVSLGKGRLHSFGKDRTTKRAISCLEKRGYLLVNSYGQAQWTGKIFDL